MAYKLVYALTSDDGQRIIRDYMASENEVRIFDTFEEAEMIREVTLTFMRDCKIKDPYVIVELVWPDPSAS